MISFPFAASFLRNSTAASGQQENTGSCFKNHTDPPKSEYIPYKERTSGTATHALRENRCNRSRASTGNLCISLLKNIHPSFKKGMKSTKNIGTMRTDFIKVRRKIPTAESV